MNSMISLKLEGARLVFLLHFCIFFKNCLIMVTLNFKRTDYKSWKIMWGWGEWHGVIIIIEYLIIKINYQRQCGRLIDLFNRRILRS